MSILAMVRPMIGSAMSHKAATTAISHFKSGAIGIVNIGGHSLSGYHSYYQHRDNYGTGGAILRGVGESLATDVAFMTFGGPGAILVGITGAGIYYGTKYGQQHYRNNRQVNFGRVTQDSYGTINKMKMASAQSLTRSRASTGRLLGNEASRFHR
jgi:hypothetical protein